MIVGIKALIGAISRKELVSEHGCDVWVCLEEAMVGFHVEDVSEQDRGVGTLTLRLRGEGGRISLMMPSLVWMDGLSG